MNKILILVLALFSFTAFAEEDGIELTELYAKNDANGYIVITIKPCSNTAWAKKYPNEAYATEANGTTHAGCWDRPDTSAAPKVPDVTIVPIVNTIWEDGSKYTFPANIFGLKDHEDTVNEKIPEGSVPPVKGTL